MLIPVADAGNRVLGERLRLARSRAGLTQEQAAERIGVARTTVVAMEKGQRRIRPDELRQLAELYGVSVNALLRASAVHVDLTPRFRALPAARAGSFEECARLLNALAAAEVELERRLGQPLRPNYPPERRLLPGDPRQQGEDAALDLRHRLGLGLAPIEDMISLLELELGVRVFVRPLSEGYISGLFAYDDEVGACMLLNGNHRPVRRALTAAHELGHLVVARREPDVVDGEDGPQSREERFATAFAIAFLMPPAAVRRRFADIVSEQDAFTPRHLLLLAHSFRVSPEAMCRRLEDLGLLKGGTWDWLKDRGFSGEEVRQVLGDARREAEPAFPPRLGWLAAGAYQRGLFTEGQLARMLHMDRVELRELLCAFAAEETEALGQLPS